MKPQDNITYIEELENSFKNISRQLKQDPDNPELQAERKRLWRLIGRLTPAKAIFVDSTQAKLNPNSADFDLEAWKQAIDEVNPPRIDEKNFQQLDRQMTLINSIARRLTESIDFNTFIDLFDRYINEGFFENQERQLSYIELDFKKAVEQALQINLGTLSQAELSLLDSDTITPEAEAISAKIVEQTTREVPQILKRVILQGSATNQLTKIIPNKNNLKLDSLGNATLQSQSGNFKLTISNYRQLAGLKTSTHQLLLFFIYKFTQSPTKNPEIVVPLAEFMQERNLKDRKEARKALEADMNVLFHAEITFEEKNRAGNKKNDEPIWVKARICDALGIVKNGNIFFSFGNVFSKILRAYNVMPFYTELLQINSKRNPYSFFLGSKILELKNMNVGKRNEDLIAVKTLLNCLPNMPTKEEVAKTNRDYKGRIIDPFERDLTELENKNMFSWEYCHAKGTPLTDEELKNFNYDTFVNCLIKITWIDYPDQTARLERKRQRIQKNEEKKLIQLANAKKRTSKH